MVKKAVVVLTLLIGLLAIPLSVTAAKGNGIPPGQNPFEYLLGLIADLQAQVDSLSGGSSCIDISESVVGTWNVLNEESGATGQVTFNADGTYTINSGMYNAGGSFLGETNGTYRVLTGGAIAFTYDGNTEVDRIAVVQCATDDQIVHFVMGHTHDYEVLTRVP